MWTQDDAYAAILAMRLFHITAALPSKIGSTAMLAFCQQPVMLKPCLGENNDGCQQNYLHMCIH